MRIILYSAFWYYILYRKRINKALKSGKQEEHAIRMVFKIRMTITETAIQVGGTVVVIVGREVLTLQATLERSNQSLNCCLREVWKKKWITDLAVSSLSGSYVTTSQTPQYDCGRGAVKYSMEFHCKMTHYFPVKLQGDLSNRGKGKR
jgi:hypothetical protein